MNALGSLAPWFEERTIIITAGCVCGSVCILRSAAVSSSMQRMRKDTALSEGGLEITAKPCCSKMLSFRWFFALLAFAGITIIHILRLNLSIVMTTIARSNRSDSVTSHDHNVSAHACSGAGDDEALQMHYDTEAEFDWSSHTQELLLASFYIGYTLTQFPAGWLADTFGGKWILAAGVSISGVMNLLGPFAVRHSLTFFIITLVVSGLAEGVAFPAINTLTAKWSPAEERTRMTSLVVSGVAFGSATGLVLSSLICSYLGWEATFYIFGSACLCWALLWSLLVYESPAVHPCISNQERRNIETERSRGSSNNKREKIPICSMLTSRPSIAWYVTMVTIAGFVVFILLTNLPLYMKHVLQLDVGQMGYLLAIPYVAYFILMTFASQISDALMKRNILNVTQIRKLIINVGAVVSAGSLLGIPHVGCSSRLTVTLMTMAMGGIGIAYSTIFVNVQDLAPRFAGTLFGIGNFISVSTGFIGPLIVGLLTVDQTDPAGWRNVFYMTAGLSLFGAVVFQLFGSAEEQDWARDTSGDSPSIETKAAFNATTNADDNENITKALVSPSVNANCDKGEELC